VTTGEGGRGEHGEQAAGKPPPEFMSALVTEHFVLLSASTTRR
jgi:hypothetical protein